MTAPERLSKMNNDQSKGGKKLFPELDNLSSSIQHFHNYHGYGEVFAPPGGFQSVVTKDYVVCSCYGEDPRHSLTEFEKLNDKKMVFISPCRHTDFQNTKSKIIYFPLGYALYPRSENKPDKELVFNRTFDKTFVSLNGRAHWPRQALYEFVDKFNLYDKCYFSYHAEDRYNRPPKQVWDIMRKDIGDAWFNEGVDQDSLFDRLPVTVDSFRTVVRDPFTHQFSGREDFYNTSFCSVVPETFIVNDRDAVFTEKIFKPLSYGHPLLVFSSQGALAKLKELGFETFESIFDESYDLIENPQLRFEAMLEQLLELTKKSDHELSLMFEKIKPVLEHNYDRFWNGLSKDYESKLEDVKEEILDYFGIDK